MARKTPPQKPVYPKQEQPRRSKPARPVYPPGVGAQRAPRRPADKRVIFDYEKEMSRGKAPPAKAGQTAVPFVNLTPAAYESTPPVQNGFAAGAGRPERGQREAVSPKAPHRAAPPGSGRMGTERPPASSRPASAAPSVSMSTPEQRPPRRSPQPGQTAPPPGGERPSRPKQAKQGRKPPKKRPPKHRPPKSPPRPLTPHQPFYATPGKGVNEIRIAYVLKQKDLERAMDLLAMGLKAYNER